MEAVRLVPYYWEKEGKTERRSGESMWRSNFQAKNTHNMHSSMINLCFWNLKPGKEPAKCRFLKINSAVNAFKKKNWSAAV